MAETNPQPNTVFIDIASDVVADVTPGPEVFPLNDATKTPEEVPNIQPTIVNPDNQGLPTRIRCTECHRFTAESEEKMLRHIRKVHRGENPYQCYMCDYSTYNSVLFEEHVRRHQGIKPYKCSHCPYRSVSKKNTKKHELIHRPDNPHKCEQCGFIARHLRSLQNHMLRQHKKEILLDEIKECPMCKIKFSNYKTLMNHRKSKKRCPECQMLMCRRLIVQHRFEEHGVLKRTFKSTDGKKALFNCAICSWEGNTKTKILLHLIHHPDQYVDENVVDTHILRELGIMADPEAAE